jgi:uncharacterized membrane protein
MIFTLKLLALCGFFISILLYYTKEQQSTWCDFSQKIRCSKVYNSPYGYIGPFSTATLGIFGYLLLLSILATFPLIWSFWVIVALNIFNCYLMYRLYITLKLICIPCTALHIINSALLICSSIAVM